ncbi:MAG TPA: ABC transporter substrate-binding protein [Acetobacteraceae bacterium]|nr:ABC transporter substrate-binding protein [Acetobacteraceae bacterium]
MSSKNQDRNIALLKRDLAAGRINRREFLRYAVLVGMAAPAAYAFVGEPLGTGIIGSAAAAMPGGGTLRLGTQVKSLKDPATYSWGGYDANVTRQVCEYLTLTDENNVTHPYLLEKWEASSDLKTWTLSVRKNVKWHNGQDFTADDVLWNLKRLADPAVGSSFIGLIKDFLLKPVPDGTDKNGKPKTKLVWWDASAIEKIDSHTIRLNGRVPQVAIPEYLFHYPALMLYPGDKGVFGTGSQGTGAFTMTEYQIGKIAAVRAVKGYWGGGPHLDGMRFIDLGDNPATAISAMASHQVDGLVVTDPAQYPALKAMPFLKLYTVGSAQTGVLRFHVDQKPWSDPRVRMAMRLGLDNASFIAAAVRGLGTLGQDCHVAPVLPDYGKVPDIVRNIAKAKKLLAEAGYPNGFDTELATPADNAWIVAESQAAIEQWKEIGARVKLNIMPGAEYWNVWTKVPFGCTIWYHRPLGVMLLNLAYRTGVPWNETGYSNPEFDRLLNQAGGILEAKKRAAVMQKLQEILQLDGPMAQPMFAEAFTFMDKKVQGFVMHPSNYIFGNKLAMTA